MSSSVWPPSSVVHCLLAPPALPSLVVSSSKDHGAVAVEAALLPSSMAGSLGSSSSVVEVLGGEGFAVELRGGFML